MRTTLITLVLAASMQIAPTLAAEVSGACGMTEIAAAFDDIDSAHATVIERVTLRWKASVRYESRLDLSIDPGTDPPNFDLTVGVVGSTVEDVASIEVHVIAQSGPTPEPDVIELVEHTGTTVSANFGFNALTFDDPDSAADEVYNLVVDLKDHEGFSLGSSDYEVVVEGLLL